MVLAMFKTSIRLSLPWINHSIHPSSSTAPFPQFRPNATISEPPNEQADYLRWPVATSPHNLPTPYQILRQSRGSPHSKQKFYELVKFYHPDRHDYGASHTGLSRTVMVERYRLIIMANEILADPIRKSQYDRTGAGWDELANAQSDSKTTCKYSAREWSHDSPFRNATWEDWEKWHKRNAEAPQEPRFISNSAFVGLILMFAVLGGIGQSARVGNYSMNFMQRQGEMHDKISKELTQRRKEVASEARDQRISGFLRQRNAGAYSMTDSRELDQSKLLPPPEMCSGNPVKQGKG